MDLDVAYIINNDDFHTYIKRHVSKESVKLAIFSATPNIWINKKIIWALQDVLVEDGVIAIETSMSNLDKTMPFCRNMSHDIIVFYDENKSKEKLQFFVDVTTVYILLYGKRSPTCWIFPPQGKIGHSNVFCSESLSTITTKLLEPTKVVDTVLLLGESAEHHVKQIKNMCRYIIAIVGSTTNKSVLSNEGLTIKEL